MDLELPFHEWNPLFVRKTSNSNLKEFTNKVMNIAYNIIHGVDLRKITKEGREWLQFTPETRVGVWFLFKDHTIIRVYGFEGKAYKLSAFLKVRIIAM